MKGTEWIEKVRHLGTNRAAVMQEVLTAVEAGHHVPWPMVEVDAGDDVKFMAAMDYFAIGETTDFVRVPLDAPTAQRVADMLEGALPTPKMVDLVWGAADVKLKPQPMTPAMGYPYDSSMMSVERFDLHNDMVEEQLRDIAERVPIGALFAGHKKDVVVCNCYVTRSPSRLCLYGLQRKDGTAIQGPYHSTGHILGYYDYLHGLRVVGKMVKVRGIHIPYAEALQNPSTAASLSSEGSLRVLRVPGVATPDEEPAPDTDPSPTAYSYELRMPVLKRGLKHSTANERWQRIIGVTADGFFGPLTEGKTKVFQKANGLPADGVVDADDWEAGLELEKKRASAPPPPPPTAVDLPDIAFVQAARYTPANRGKGDIWWIVIHDMEAPEHPGTAENVGAWFAGPNHPEASAHYNVDCDSIVQSVRDKDVAWHAKKGNRRGIGIEHAGYYHQTDAEWKDDYSIAMLRLSAALTASLCAQYDIPIRFVDEEGLRAGEKGITYHATITKAFKVRGGHIDPGKNFPIELYLDMVRAATPS
jgi:peptidoglycan hydrolase-like protein with peptidoglycan-binding domain